MATCLFFTSSAIEPTDLFAAPIVEAPSVSPASIVPNTPTQVLVELRVIRSTSDPEVVPNGLYLHQVDANNKYIRKLGDMRDDGAEGDRVAGDDIWTYRALLNQAAAGEVRLQASVAFRRVVRRVLSPVTTIAVSSSNGPPVFTSTPSLEAVESLEYVYPITTEDPEDDAVTLALESGPEGLVLNGESIHWFPKGDQAGDHEVIIRASDPYNPPVLQTFTITVIELNVTPVITSVPGTFAKTGEKYEYHCKAYDADGDTIGFGFVQSPPSGMTLDPQTCLVEWTPGPGDTGSKTVALQAADSAGGSDVQTYQLEVYPAGVDLSLLSPAGEHQVHVGEALTLPFQANLPNAVFSSDLISENASMTQASFEFKPAAEQAGSHVFVFKAAAAGQTVSNLVTINVIRDEAVNHPPVFSVVADQNVQEGQSLAFTLQATDVDSDALTFKAPGLSLPNAYFNELTRQFVFMPSFEQSGIYQVVFSVTDGIETVQKSVSITVEDVVPSVSLLDLVVDPTPNPTFRTKLPVSGSVTGQTGAPAAPESPKVVTALLPSSGKQGESLDVVLSVNGVDLTPGAVVASFGDGISVQAVEVLGAGSAKASIQIEKGAELGSRQVELVQDASSIPSLVAFEVLESKASIQGIVKDAFDQQPIVGAKVGINGTFSFTLTDAQGAFTLPDAPTGTNLLIVAKQNYSVGKISVSLGAGEELQIEPEIFLNALARPAAHGGSLPAEPTLVSVLDRGVSKKGGGFSFEEAKAVVRDTLIAIGGIEAGVFDESGKQLNPKIQGSGEFSLTPEGVEQHAKALMLGEVVTLRDFFSVLQGAFSFPNAPTLGDFTDGLQRYVEESWANPGDPGSGMAFILFNEGTSLSTRVPRVTADTRLNRFQVYLLFSSFLIFTSPSLDWSINEALDKRGVDYESLMPAPRFPDTNAPQGPTDQGRSILLAFAGQVDDWLVPSVMAQTPQPNCHDTKQIAGDLACQMANLQNKKTFSKVWRSIGANMIAESATAALNAAALTFAQQSAISYAMGASGGRFGATIAVLNLSAAAVQGAVSVIFFKLVMGWVIAAAVASMEPPAPEGKDSFKDDQGNFVIRFALVPEHVRTAVNPPPGEVKKDFAYHLYRVPDCAAPTDAAKAQYIALKAEPDYTDAANRKTPALGTHKFVVPATMLKADGNCFRIRSFQYIHNKNQDLIEGIAPYDTNNDDGVDRNEYDIAGLGGQTHFFDVDKDGSGKIDPAEFAAYSLTKIPTELEIAPGVPGSAALRTLMGKPNLLPGSQPGSYQHTLAQNNEALNARASGRIDPFSNGYKARTNIVDFFSKSPFSRGNAEFLPEIELFVDNRKAFLVTDDVILSTNVAGRQALLDGDDAVASRIAEAAYAKHLGTTPNAEQKASVAEIVAAKRQIAIANDKMMFLTAAEKNITNTIFDIKVGRVTSGKIELVVPTFPNPETMEMKVVNHEFNLTAANANEVLAAIGEVGEYSASKPTGQAFVQKFKTSVELGQANSRATLAQGPVLSDALQVSSGLSAAEVEQKFVDFIPKKNGQGVVGQSAARMADVQEKELRVLIADMKKRRVGSLTIQEPSIDPRTVSFQKGVGAFTNFAGQVVGGSSALLTFLQNVQVLSSDFSESCFETKAPAVPVPTEPFPPSFEPYPGADEPSAIIRELKAGPKQGYLQREYPGDDEHIAVINAGFPPGFVSSDRKGRAYAINMASTERFGGRIFRFKLSPAEGNANAPRGFTAVRELVGAVNYYSTMIQLARPAFPLAMTVGPTFKAGTPQVETQDMFIADTDIVDGHKRILKLYTSLIDTHPTAYTESRRNHLVGQPVIINDDLRFTGPSDMEVGPDPAFPVPEETENSVIMLSDEDTIYAIVRTPGTETYTLQKVISIAGRRFSGLAFDRLGRFYMADYARGEVLLMDWETLRGFISANSHVAGESHLKSSTYLIATGLDRPGDIELEGISTHPGGVLHVSTFSGILPITLPIIGKLGQARDVRLKLFGVEQSVSIDPDRGTFQVTPSRELLETMAGTIRFNRVDPDTGDVFPSESIILIAEHGVTILKDPLA